MKANLTIDSFLDGMTPEVFGISIRGTACGTSAALSRLYVQISNTLRDYPLIQRVIHSTGIMAPVLAGVLLSISPALPLVASAAIFAATAACAIMLPFEKAPEPARGAGSSHAHLAH